MITQLRSARSWIGVSFLFAMASCGGGGGGGGHAALVVSGSVLSPNGQVITLQGSGSGRPARTPVETSLSLGLSGLLPVPDGTPVDLVRLDALGDPLEVLASTTTSAGHYSFNLSSLQLAFASDLAVTAGSGASRMRALVVEESVDVDPLTEAVVQLILQQGVGFDEFTLLEVRDLVAAVRLLARTESITAQADVAATVALVQQTVLGSSSLVDFFSAAAAPGQTSEGPGDIGEFFPLSVGDSGKFYGTGTSNGLPTIPFASSRRVVEVDPDGVFSVEEIERLDVGTTVDEFLEKTSQGVVNHGNDDPDDELTQAVQPFLEIRFPLRAGDERELFDVPGIVLSDDLDSDGLPDSMDVRAVETTVGFEDQTVIAGTFEGCVRLDTRLDTTFHLSSGAHATAMLLQSDWLAPHRGLVRTESDTTIVVEGESSNETSQEQLAAYQVGNEGHGVVPPFKAAIDLTTADSNEGRPGRPGLAFDGTNYLLVTCRDLVSPSRLVGILLGPTGLALQEFTIFDQNFNCDGSTPSVSFDGVNYLVVFQLGGQVLGVRVAPDGTVLDPAGILISTTGTSNFSTAVAFDGTRYLVAWRKFNNPTDSGEIYASFVTPAGAAVGEFPIHSAPGDQGNPDMVFANGNYVVVWQDDAPATREVRGARVTPAGAVLDPASFDVATEAEDELAPRIGSDGNRYLVVWAKAFPAGWHLYGARLEADGTQTDPAPFPIDTGAQYVGPGSVGFDGTNYFVTWEIGGFSAPFGIHGSRISPDGKLLDGAPDSNAITIAEPSAFGLLAFPVIAVGGVNSMLVWLINNELSGTTKSIGATMIYPF